ncbi:MULTISPECIES: hypothetical protein [Mesorhizobium]|uniref:hypothetical protein n=1 Tax=Mesorhizobium TaxID=68287 RepID=UPI0007A95351|nr:MULTISPECIES: hypothetical protein [Mesorhizobium]AMX93671.1 hypothetical protein A4R28_11460 [Mesorhizobium ciceri]MDF3208364.1 hypothetical protein [Mesorhizobium sp. LMG15046]MDF3229064.1 hypothetical protein [Mesorhizobium sp. DSM 30133]RUU22177.1 hypothetical protein EOC84_03435 [Mesorhizobium sp. Primo-B]RUU37913.1 hypothetical protein EOC83_16780 [Mesorhizobium sp. Primo-A]
MITLTEQRTTNMGNVRRHWDMMRDGKHVANLGKDNAPWSRWSVLPIVGSNECDLAKYDTFKSKAEALAYAEAL